NGANGPFYTIGSVSEGDASSYDVIVSGPCGNITSAAANLTLNSGANISIHPQGTSACLGQSASFTVSASGATGYQWRKNGVSINGANGPFYTLASVSAVDVGNYDVVVSSPCGGVTSTTASLTLNEGARIIGPPQNASACLGNGASFTVS